MIESNTFATLIWGISFIFYHIDNDDRQSHINFEKINRCLKTIHKENIALNIDWYDLFFEDDRDKYRWIQYFKYHERDYLMTI